MSKDAAQIEFWKSKFGDQYTDRNNYDPNSRLTQWKEMLAGIECQSILEVGCNRGLNLVVLKRLFPHASFHAVEPNDHARACAISSCPWLSVVSATARDLPYEDGRFDLSFTVDVLIHVAPNEMKTTVHELARVSRNYVLSVEYFGECEKEVRYHDHTSVLWRRNVCELFAVHAPELSVIRSGFWSSWQTGFSDCHWWLWKKA